MRIYIDTEFKCHTANPDGIYREMETDFFDGKCDAFIEGYCYELKDNGTAIYPWRDYSELDTAQREYERQLIKELQENSVPIAALEAAYQEGVNSV